MRRLDRDRLRTSDEPFLTTASANAVSVISTTYSKSFPKTFQRLPCWAHLTAFQVLHANSDRGNGLQFLKAVKHILVAGCILNDEFRPAVHSQDERCFGIFELANILLGIALKLGDGTYFTQIDHRRLSIQKAHYKQLIRCAKSVRKMEFRVDIHAPLESGCGWI